jgi:hypothetical protein
MGASQFLARSYQKFPLTPSFAKAMEGGSALSQNRSDAEENHRWTHRTAACRYERAPLN